MDWVVSALDSPNICSAQQRQERNPVSAVALLVGELRLKASTDSLAVSGSLLFASVLPLGFPGLACVVFIALLHVRAFPKAC